MTQFAINQLQCLHLGPINLAIEQGQCVSIGGASGTGKSILLRALIDLIPNQGKVCYGEQKREQMRASQWRKLVGLLPAESFWWCNQVGGHFPELNEQQKDWFAALGFEHQVLDWELSRCSTGERQRLALLRLLCNEPEVLLLDEPTANLDKHNTEKVESIIQGYREKHDCPVVWVSHDHDQIKRVASQYYELGKDGGLQEVLL